MARPSSGIRKRQLEISLPEAMIEDLRQLFYDPRTGMVQVGARSAYIECLIREDFEKRQKGDPQ